MKSGDKVCIGMINDGKIVAELVIDLIQIARKRADRFDSFMQVSNSGLITRSRNKLVKTFLEETDAEWLLMMDSDERMTLDNFDLLIQTAHDKDRPVVSALVFAQFDRPVPTIYNEIEGRGRVPIDDYPINSVIKVDACGTGCLLIHRSVLLTIQQGATENQGKDWAWFVDGAIAGTWISEDLLFSKRLQSLGIPIHCHTGAVLAHKKEYWIDDKDHAPIRDLIITQSKQEG